MDGLSEASTTLDEEVLDEHADEDEDSTSMQDCISKWKIDHSSGDHRLNGILNGHLSQMRTN